MLKPSLLCLGLLALPGLSTATEPKAKPPASTRPLAAPGALEAAHSAPRVQIALLLDTSSSMDGLIEQTKRQLWTVVNAFQNARQAGKPAQLEIALYEYGNDGLSAEGGYIRQVMPLSTDLDRVSEKLFALRTNGGQEYCGQAIQKATQQLKWSDSPRDLKLIYIAGNEEFNQGPVRFQGAISAAKERGITVNTIYCGSPGDAEHSGWTQGARLANGKSFSIDQDKAVAHIAAPQDEEIARLGRELNKTYLGYGSGGKEAKVRQEAQDSNAAGHAASATTRAVSKSSRHYDNSGWDLVDATKKGKVAVGALKDDELPEELRGKSAEERTALIQAKAQEREALQASIQKLNQEREKFVSEQQKQAAKEGGNTLDKAILDSVHGQATQQGFAL